jgi:hypothetical protein
LAILRILFGGKTTRTTRLRKPSTLPNHGLQSPSRAFYVQTDTSENIQTQRWCERKPLFGGFFFGASHDRYPGAQGSEYPPLAGRQHRPEAPGRSKRGCRQAAAPAAKVHYQVIETVPAYHGSWWP